MTTQYYIEYSVSIFNKQYFCKTKFCKTYYFFSKVKLLLSLATNMLVER